MENMINSTNYQPTLTQTLLNDLKEAATSALNEEYQAEKRMIDGDTNMTTNEKIKARRQSFAFYVFCAGGLLLGSFIVAHYLK